MSITRVSPLTVRSSSSAPLQPEASGNTCGAREHAESRHSLRSSWLRGSGERPRNPCFLCLRGVDSGSPEAPLGNMLPEHSQTWRWWRQGNQLRLPDVVSKGDSGGGGYEWNVLRGGAKAELQESGLRKADAGLMVCGFKARPRGSRGMTPVWSLALVKGSVTTCDTLSFAEGVFINSNE